MITGKRFKVMNPLAVLLLAFLGLTSCQTLGDQIVSSTLGEEIWTQLRAAQDQLWLLEASVPGPAESDWLAYRAGLEQLKKEGALDRGYLSRWNALAGAWAYLQDRPDEARKHLKEWKTLEGLDETGQWLELVLVFPEDGSRLQELEDRASRRDHPLGGRLGMELGELLYKAGRFSEAAAMVEQSLKSWGRGTWPRWNLLWEQAMKMRIREGADPLEGRWLTQDPLTWEGLVGLTQTRTEILRPAGSIQEKPERILGWMTERGYLETPVTEAALPVTRRASAWLLGKFIQDWEGRSELLMDLAAAYRSASPVPDVSAGDPALGAVILAVERQLLDLPDGRRFRGNLPVNGGEWAGILEKLLKKYPHIQPGYQNRLRTAPKDD